MIPRDTLWRQGSCLTPDSCYALSIFPKSATDKRVVVVSHDCDLPHEHEEFIEVVVGLIIPQAEPCYSRAKNPRRLHVTYKDLLSSQFSPTELIHAQKLSIPKKQFAQIAQQDSNLMLPIEELRVLRYWLAIRYGRAAFPTAFESRLREKKLDQKLADKLRPHEQYLVGVFFDLGEERALELPIGVPYFLRIIIVYDAMEGSAARIAAETCATAISALFLKASGPPDTARELVLESCRAIADTHFSLADIRKVDQWRLDYMSLGEDSQGAFLAVGEIPV